MNTRPRPLRLLLRSGAPSKARTQIWILNADPDRFPTSALTNGHVFMKKGSVFRRDPDPTWILIPDPGTFIRIKNGSCWL